MVARDELDTIQNCRANSTGDPIILEYEKFVSWSSMILV